MKVASFNIENLFARHRDLLGNATGNRESLIVEFDGLVYKNPKSNRDYERMRELWNQVESQNGKRERLRAFAEYEIYLLSNSSFLKGRQELISFLNTLTLNSKLRLIPIGDIGNKAAMLQQVSADVLLLQEVESLEALQLFNLYFLDGMYQEVHFGATGDLEGRGMGLLLKHTVHLKCLSSISGPPLRSGNSSPRGYIQRYRLESESIDTLELLNVFLAPDTFDRWTRFSDTELGLLEELVRHYFCTENGPSFLMGCLNVPNYSNVLKKFLKHLGLIKLNDLGLFSSNLITSMRNGYDPLGGYGCGIPLRQRDYVLALQQRLCNIKAAGIHVAPDKGILSADKTNSIEINTRPCQWFVI